MAPPLGVWRLYPRPLPHAAMTEHDEKPFTLSREDLYELVWSKPMRGLAKDFGISDVRLAKRCRRLAITVPGRGYWARIDAGHLCYVAAVASVAGILEIGVRSYFLLRYSRMTRRCFAAAPITAAME